MFSVLWKTLMINFLGIGLLIGVSLLLDFVFGSEISDWITLSWKSTMVVNGVGTIAVALAIWDGQFIDDVKPTHWTRRRG